METNQTTNGALLHFYTSLEVAKILKMHPQVITRKLQAGEIGGYKLGKDWRVSEVQLFEFLARHSNERESSMIDAPQSPSSKKSGKTKSSTSPLRS